MVRPSGLASPYGTSLKKAAACSSAKPTAQGVVMESPKEFVLDGSVTMAWYFKDEATYYVI